MSMRIDTKPGEKLIVSNFSNGTEHDQKKAKLYLSRKKTYTLEYINAGDYHSEIKVKGINESFNSVNFDNA